jgi:hypothetical protein
MGQFTVETLINVGGLEMNASIQILKPTENGTVIECGQL